MDSRFISKHITDGQFHQPTEEDLSKYFDKYDMTHKKRGIAYIFNNENFKNPELITRQGSSKDTQNFKTALLELGFHEDDINVYTDATSEEMLDALKVFGKENPDIGIDCFICAILSHGGPNDIIYGYDGAVELDKLIFCLRPDRCPCLKGVPKLVFVEASRGSKLDHGVVKLDADLEEYEERPSPIPIMADMLIVYSSSAGYHSFRDKQKGSWFMQALSKMLIKHGTEFEILTLLTAVCNYVASLKVQSSSKSIYNGCKQMPCFGSSLIKQLKFVRKN